MNVLMIHDSLLEQMGHLRPQMSYILIPFVRAILTLVILRCRIFTMDSAKSLVVQAIEMYRFALVRKVGSRVNDS